MSVTWRYMSSEGVSFCLYVNLTLVTPNSVSWGLFLQAFLGGRRLLLFLFREPFYS